MNYLLSEPEQWFSAGGHLAMSGDILDVSLGEEEGVLLTFSG
jgi:hypothetical protein